MELERGYRLKLINNTYGPVNNEVKLKAQVLYVTPKNEERVGERVFTFTEGTFEEWITDIRSWGMSVARKHKADAGTLAREFVARYDRVVLNV